MMTREQQKGFGSSNYFAKRIQNEFPIVKSDYIEGKSFRDIVIYRKLLEEFSKFNISIETARRSVGKALFGDGNGLEGLISCPIERASLGKEHNSKNGKKNGKYFGINVALSKGLIPWNTPYINQNGDQLASDAEVAYSLSKHFLFQTENNTPNYQKISNVINDLRYEGEDIRNANTTRQGVYKYKKKLFINVNR